MSAAPRRRRSACRAAVSCAVLMGCAAGAAQAQSLAAAPASPAAAASSASAPGQGLKRNVIEDDNVRIEETRLRGLPQRITVHDKTTGGSYEILVGPRGKDPSQNKSTAGRSAWSLFDF